MSKYQTINNPTNTLATTLATSIDASVTTLTLSTDTAKLPAAPSFDIVIESEIIHVGARAGVTLSSLVRGSGGSTAASHTAGVAIWPTLTTEALLAAPGPKTTSGDMEYLGADLRPVRLAAPGDGDFATHWASSVPTWVAASGTGDVVGPSSSVDNAIARFDGTTGKLLQGYTSSAPTISDTGLMLLRAPGVGTDNSLELRSEESADYTFGLVVREVTNTGTGSSRKDCIFSWGYNIDRLKAPTEPECQWVYENFWNPVSLATSQAEFYLQVATADGLLTRRPISINLTNATPNVIQMSFTGDVTLLDNDNIVWGGLQAGAGAGIILVGDHRYNYEGTVVEFVTYGETGLLGFVPGTGFGHLCAGCLTTILSNAWDAAAQDIKFLFGQNGARGFRSKASTGKLEFSHNGSTWSEFGVGDALVADPLSQFAATTSLQLKNTISDETGSGSLVFATSPTLVAPLTLTGAVGSTALTIAGATQTASFPVISAAQTWNGAGVTFTGALLNITRTASADASKLLDLQKDGVSVFAVGVRADNGANPTLQLGGDTTAGWYRNAANQWTFAVNNNDSLSLITNQVRVGSACVLNWTPSNSTSGGDVGLARNAAGVLEINSASAGTFRDLKLRNIVGLTGYHEIIEMTAPAAGATNALRLYAEDLAGKTRLMVKFATGAAQQVAIEI